MQAPPSYMLLPFHRPRATQLCHCAADSSAVSSLTARAASPCSFLTPLEAAVKEYVDRQHSERERDEHQHKHG